MAAKWPLNWSVLACFLLNTCLAQLNNHPTKTNAVSIVLLYPFTSCDQLITEFPFASAFLVAVETINSSREFNFSLSVQWNDTRCSELVGIATMSEQWKRGVKAFIGPGNQSYCATSARIAASWNIPMISYVIIILATNPEYAPAFMVSASKQGMTNGDYVYIVSTLSEIYLGQAVDYWWAGISGAVNQTEAKKAWNSVLTLVPSPHNVTKYKKFQKRVVAKLNDFHGVRTRTSQTPENTLHYAAYLYDAVYLYALALNKTISNGQHPRNGVAVVDNTKDIYFESVTGFHVHVDVNGDAVFNMVLLDFLKTTSRVGEMKAVGEFKLVKSGNQTLELFPDMNISWSEDGQQTSPPVDTPPCGFNFELCSTASPGPTMRPDKNVHIVVAVVISILIVACCALVIFFGRKYSFEKELANQIWKVNYGDIVRRSTMGIGLSRLSNMSELNTIGRRQSSDITLGTYKGNPVVIKRVEKDNIDLTRAVLLELKQIRDVHHVNLTKFFGACVDAPNICILTEFCSRGSLQEIILNEEIKLDIIFIHSFMLDIAMGMEHIHSVDIKFHGHLTSSNCVVDSRWVLKITDHGLREFKSANDLLKLLWTAPEILRQRNNQYNGSPKGDVYSFGIIVHELETRGLPFSECRLDPEGQFSFFNRSRNFKVEI
ncbi:Resact receptor [Acropora cervicornis]|uniref:guanylate cyclase n=1 Tax=Acropora cervicornis TaxID=6130 RepID=A0AAD9R1T5_ACRCE|nr:Resact receptor [Acropora cervicornis]